MPSFAALQRGRLSREDYVQLLLRLLGLHAPLEERQLGFQAEPLLAWMRAAPEESRAARLRRDLSVLGVDHSVIEAAPRAENLLPRVNTQASALGAAWVVEGSALGGRILAKLLHDYLGIGSANGGAFFAPQPLQQARWSACCAAVENCGRHETARGDMRDSARDTMRAFADWMSMETAA